MAEDQSTAAEQAAEVDLDAPVTRPGGYVENPDHTPNPYFQTGTLETTDLGTTAAQQIHGVSPVFEVARAQNLQTAARALDPNDPTVSSDLVILPAAEVTVQGSAKTAADARQEVFDAVQHYIDNPVSLGISPAAQDAARGIAPEDVDDSVSDEEQARQEAKADAQAVEEGALADVRERSADSAAQASEVSSARSTAGRDTGPESAPVAGSSATPSATVVEEDAKTSGASSTPSSTSGSSSARKSSSSSTAGKSNGTR